MKNFELYIDKIAQDYEEKIANCWIADTNCGLCFDVRVPCSECFKKWALADHVALIAGVDCACSVEELKGRTEWL